MFDMKTINNFCDNIKQQINKHLKLRKSKKIMIF